MSDPIRVPVQPAEQGMPRPYLLIDADLARQIVALDDTTSTRLLSIEAHLQALADRTSAIAEIQRDDHEKGLAGRVGALEARLDGVPGAEYDAMVDRMTAEITALRAQLDNAKGEILKLQLEAANAEDEIVTMRAEAEKLAGLLRDALPDITDAACHGQVASDIIERIDAALAARAKVGEA
jgi:chromosome segregation ATPase